MIVGGKAVKKRELDQAMYQSLKEQGYREVMARLYAGRQSMPSHTIENAILRKETLHYAMDAGVVIGEHIMAGNTIAVSLDFDADGMNSYAIVYKAIKAFGGKVKGYCPDRTLEGYGINSRIVREAYEDGCSCILCVDNGIVAFEPVLEAKKLGLDIVITDHHMCDKSFKLPEADVIVNPWAERGSNQFASKNLCGAGVAWYVMACTKDYLEKMGWQHKFAMKSVIDLLAIATVGDMVNLGDPLNRQIVRMGLEKINHQHVNLGVQALIDVSGRNEGPVNSQTIGFVLAPMINSSSRLGTADRAIQLLCTEDEKEAYTLANELKEVNNERKLLQKQMSELAIENLAMEVSSHSACILNPEFKEGIIGLVASKVKEVTNLPTGVFTVTERGYIKGSFRSVPGVHIRDVLDLVRQRRPDINFRGGGHAQAAGGSLDKDKWLIFKETFNEAVKKLAEKDAFTPTLLIDGVLNESDIDISLVEEMDEEIWGQGMPSPLFAGEIVISDQKILNGGHCKFNGKIGRLSVPGIFFGRKTLLPERCNLVYTLSINLWNGNKSVQMMVQGIDDSQGGLFND